MNVSTISHKRKNNNTMFVDVVHGRIAADEQYNERKRKQTYTLTTLVCKTTSMQKAKLQSTLDTNNLQYRITRNSCERDDRSRGSKSIEKKNVLIVGAGNLFMHRGIQSKNCSNELPQDSSNDLQRIAATESAQTNDR